MATNVSTIKRIISLMPSSISILMRGPTGIGKSHIARDLAKDLKYPYIDVRGSVMDESAVGGLPDLDAISRTKVATFILPSWYIRACKEPCVLMLDEINRSMSQVMQSMFQIVLDRELGNNVEGEPMRLHPDTRVIAAANYGAEYDVNEMDPALLRRFAVFDVEPDIDSWLEWAEDNGISSSLRKFLREKKVHFWVDPSTANPGNVIPSPASWDRLDMTLRHMGIGPNSMVGKSGNPLFFSVSTSMVGIEATAALSDYLSTLNSRVSAMEIFEGFEDVSERLDRENASLLNSISDDIITEMMNLDQELPEGWENELKKFCQFAGGEITVKLWSEISTRRSDMCAIDYGNENQERLSKEKLKKINSIWLKMNNALKEDIFEAMKEKD